MMVYHNAIYAIYKANLLEGYLKCSTLNLFTIVPIMTVSLKALPP